VRLITYESIIAFTPDSAEAIATKLVARGEGGGAVGETAQWPEKGGTITSLR